MVCLWTCWNRMVHSSRFRFISAYLNVFTVSVMPVHTITLLFRYAWHGFVGEGGPKRYDGITADLLPNLWICRFHLSLVIITARHRAAARAASKAGVDLKRNPVGIFCSIRFVSRRVAGMKAC